MVRRDIPGTVDSGDGQAVHVGVKFQTDTPGYITGIRFYKASANYGVHVGNLWTETGTLLATAIFTNETPTGWQQVNFSAPVAVTANTVYVASYHTNVGHYSADQYYFAQGVDNPPLHALADGVSGVNGVYGYGPLGTFPNQGHNSSNYWVDVVFSTTVTPDTTAPSVTLFTLLTPTAADLTVAINNFTATDNIGVTGYMVNETAGAPSATAIGWLAKAPTSYTFTSAGSKTLYAWAKDAANNVSTSRSASVTINPVAPGVEPVSWYAGDMHVHRNCGDASGGIVDPVSTLYTMMDPQNLSVISLLADMGNGEVQYPVTDLPLVNGQDDPVSTAGRTVHWDAEWHWDAVYTTYPHQALGGHIVSLGLTEAHQIWSESTYSILDWAHQQNAIAGFVHMQYLNNDIPQTLDCCTPIEYPVEVALGAADFIAEDVAGSDTAIQAYYRLLNNGLRPGLAAGTDYPCGVSELGSLLTYVQVPAGQMTYRNWIDGIAKGRTVVSRNGHNEFLKLTVNNSATPGDEIKLAGAGSVPVTVQWTANQSLTGTIELVQNGVVVASKQASVSSGAPDSLTATVDFAKSGWLAARRMDSANGHMVHTGAVFVTINDAPVRVSVDDANFYVSWMDNLLLKTSPTGSWNSYFPTNLDRGANAVPECEGRVSAGPARYRRTTESHYSVASARSVERALHDHTGGRRRTIAVHLVAGRRFAANGAFARQRNRSYLRNTH